MTEAKEDGTRLLHIRVPEDLHRLLRIRAAEWDVSVSGAVANILANELGWEPKKTKKGGKKK